MHHKTNHQTEAGATTFGILAAVLTVGLLATASAAFIQPEAAVAGVQTAASETIHPAPPKTTTVHGSAILTDNRHFWTGPDGVPGELFDSTFDEKTGLATIKTADSKVNKTVTIYMRVHDNSVPGEFKKAVKRDVVIRNGAGTANFGAQSTGAVNLTVVEGPGSPFDAG
ncbi:hypothetical protein ACWG8W_06550 [Citricoccus zhacaiensis]